ncbi:dephospho-CoA kinase [Allobranchiibius sp. CTAmp26]|uniref:dephospho-CoA kinase n=1 Tax=Allobranchiibius sp. CTAmp26 TaxID=2815214 RepID=UPI001AA1933E|nr:dephospho-CoA kinase [Allobranchiibius sp. CTAmp26]MBO1754086.1 dephospho-CoA kinase [Allobranchiibius sp. CTAmp26]
MLRVGLTGGIGSGKSSVSGLLAERGAVVVDADRVAREVVEPGTPGLAQIEHRFGRAVLASDGSLDRPALGAIVFADPAARRDLEQITHPLIGVRTRELIEQAGPDAIVIHDQPLLVEMGLAPMNHLTVVVGASEQTRVQRVVRDRGMSEQDARARIEAQADDAARHAVADSWIDNDGTQEQLADRVAALWDERLAPFDGNLRADRPVLRETCATVVLHEHRPEWAARAARVIARIRHQLDAADIPYAGLEHVGSTAVPGLVARDVVDVQVRMHHLQDRADALPGALRAAAVVGLRADQDRPHDWAPRPADWRTLRAGGADPCDVVRVHVREDGSPGARAVLSFRDWLRADAGERAAYSELKSTVAHQFSSHDYPAAIERWYARALPRAREWARSTGWSPS